MKIWVAYRWDNIDGLVFPAVQMITTDEHKVREFATKHEYLVREFEDGEEWPDFD